MPCLEEPQSSQGHPYQTPPWLSLSASFTLLSLLVSLAATRGSSRSSDSIKLKEQKGPLPNPGLASLRKLNDDAALPHPLGPAVSTASHPPLHLMAGSEMLRPLLVPELDLQETGWAREVSGAHHCAEVTPVAGKVAVRMWLLGAWLHRERHSHTRRGSQGSAEASLLTSKLDVLGICSFPV